MPVNKKCKKCKGTGKITCPKCAGKGVITLTKRQLEVAALLLQGCSNKEIGKEMSIAEPTVKHYIEKMVRLFEATNRVSLAVAIMRDKHVTDKLDIKTKENCGVS